MRYLSTIFLVAVCTLLANTAVAQSNDQATGKTQLKEETFKVYGNCGMCKRTIQGAFKDVESVSFAEWDVETKMMTVRYDAEAISLDEIKQRIADVGYDTESHRAPQEVYDNLHGCCKYERPKEQPRDQ